jgi:hypothetical protein
MKASCPVPEGKEADGSFYGKECYFLLRKAIHLELHPFSNKDRVSLPSNSCLHSFLSLTLPCPSCDIYLVDFTRTFFLAFSHFCTPFPLA